MFHLNINVNVGFDARRSLAMTVKKYKEKVRAERVTKELQLMQEKNADELFARLHPEIERLTRRRVEELAHGGVGHLLEKQRRSLSLKT